MGNNAINYELVARMLDEFVIEGANRQWVNPDICKKGAAAINELLSVNKRLKNLLIGKCSACQHRGNYDLSSPCDSCILNPRLTGNGWGRKSNWKLNPNLELPQSTLNKPIAQEQLRGMAEKPYWHVGLQPESKAPHWAILPTQVAMAPQDYFYGKYWLAYLAETADTKQPEAEIQSMPAPVNDSGTSEKKCDNCTVTGSPCCYCQPGPCGSREECVE